MLCDGMESAGRVQRKNEETSLHSRKWWSCARSPLTRDSLRQKNAVWSQVVEHGFHCNSLTLYSWNELIMIILEVKYDISSGCLAHKY